MTTTMQLSALSPDYLLARVELDEARSHLKRAERAPGRMERRNEDHGRELEAAIRSGNPFVTNGVALRRGGGSGAEVLYRRCDCDGTADCEHDPTEAPYTAEDIEAAHGAVKAARKRLAEAQKRLVSTDASFDAFAAAREVGAAFCWWPAQKFVDPRLRRFRGQPISALELERLGPHELRRGIQNGGIVEVPS